MTDELYLLLESVAREQQTQRAHVQAIADNVNAMCTTCARIEGQLSTIAERLDDHSLRLKEECLKVAEIQRGAAWVKAWSAGAAAVLVAMFSTMVWACARLPEIARIVGGK